MKIKQVSAIEYEGDKPYSKITIGKGASMREFNLDLADKDGKIDEEYLKVKDLSKSQPIKYSLGRGNYIFHDRVLTVENDEGLPEKELLIKIKHWVLQKEKAFERVEKQIDSFEKMNETEAARRENIIDSVKLFVWQRDQGKCVKCGSNEKLEFDHIVPVVLGGSNTERNIQILCEPCNRSKGKNLA